MQINLKKDSWHYKLQCTIVGKTNFQNFCPYFWLTIFCLLASPFYFGAKLIGKIFMWIISLLFLAAPIFVVLGKGLDMVYDFFDKNICLPLEKKSLETPDPETLLKLYHDSRYFYIKNHNISEKDALSWLIDRGTADGYSKKKVMSKDRKFRLWVEMTGEDWYEKLLAIDTAWRLTAEEQEKKDKVARSARYEAGREREKRLAKIAANTQKAAPYFLSLIGIGFLYLIYLAGSWMHENGVFFILWKTLTGTIWAIAHFFYSIIHFLLFIPWFFSKIEWLVILSLPFIGILAARILNKCDLNLTGLAPALNAIPKFFYWIGTKVDRIITTLKDVAGFFIDYIKETKKGYCPAIKWED